MAGTREGGLKTAAKNLANDPDFYKKMGRLGGIKTGPNKGFARMSVEEPGKHIKLSAKGGRISRRGKAST